MDHPFKNFDSSKFKMGNEPDTVVTEAPETPAPDEELDGGEVPEEKPPVETAVEESNEDGQKPPVTDDEPDGGEEQSLKPGTEPEFVYGEDEFKEDVNSFLTETTQGRIKSPEQITNLLHENETLKTQLKNKPLEFPSEQAKKVYEFAIKTEFKGNELGAARQYLHLQSLDLTKLSPKEKQFEAFVLSRPDLPREKANQIFEARYAGKYSDMENDLVLQDEHTVDTRTAEQKILDYQKDFEKAKESTQPQAQPEVNVQELEQNVNAALSDFDGIEMQFGESPDEVVQLPMTAEEVSAFKDVLVNPIKLLDQVVENCMVNGKIDMDAYQRTMYKILNVDRAVDEAYRAGVNNGQLKLIQERKNTAIPKGNNGAPVAPKKTFAQTMGDAVKASQKR